MMKLLRVVSLCLALIPAITPALARAGLDPDMTIEGRIVSWDSTSVKLQSVYNQTVLVPLSTVDASKLVEGRYVRVELSGNQLHLAPEEILRQKARRRAG